MNHKSGFTLIELLVVVTLFSIAAIGGSGMFISLVRNNQKSQSLLELKRLGDSTMTGFEREITWAKKITYPTCGLKDVQGAVVQRLEFQNVDDKVVTFRCNRVADAGSDYLRMETEDGDVDYISQDVSNVQVSDCSMQCNYNLSRYNAQISFTLQSETGETQEFTMNQTLRNSQP